MPERQTKAGNQENFQNFQKYQNFHTLSLDMLNNFCFHVYAQKSLCHSHSFSLSHSQSNYLSSSLMEDTPKCVTVLKAKLNKIVPQCSFSLGFLHLKSNFRVFNSFKIFSKLESSFSVLLLGLPIC